MKLRSAFRYGAKRVEYAILVALLLFATTPAIARTLEGRVESVEQSAQPQFPTEMLRGTESDTMPDQLAGKWYGNVTVSQLEMYPQLHTMHPYCMQFISQLQPFFGLGQTGHINMLFRRDKANQLSLQSSDVVLQGRVKLQMTPQPGPALVPGGRNVPTTMVNKVRVVGDSVDQTRIDDVSIVDEEFGREVHHGFTEISAHYTIIGPKKMEFKFLEVDYDAQHIPLWKILLSGTATK